LTEYYDWLETKDEDFQNRVEGYLDNLGWYAMG
jgi:hypothetical protein